jgi:hypothetical protein
MKKIAFTTFFVLVIAYGVFADSPAEDLRYSFFETDGYCIVDGQRLHYWLYDTSVYNGDGSLLVRAFLTYAERIGWTIDYDNYRIFSPNNELAESVKRMMIGKRSDMSMTIIEHSKKSATLVINNYDSTNNSWWSRFYLLVK